MVMKIRERMARFLFADVMAEAAREAATAVTVQVDDASGWQLLAGSGPQDRSWSDHYQDLEDALEAWRKSFLVRRIVTLTRSYVVAGGITVTSRRAQVERFARAFWSHPKNRMKRRLGPLCDELTRAGEVFPVLFTNRVDGMSYVRTVPASQIRHVETDPQDYEQELAYVQEDGLTVEGKRWLSPEHPEAQRLAADGSIPPVMLHWAVNRPIGATRGEGDLGPILPWARRYGHWLQDRVRLNRIRTRQALLDVELADDSLVREKRRELEAMDPVMAGIYVHGRGEKVTTHRLEIGANDAASDGRALRLAIAAGANTGLHYLGEGEGTNYATAKEMGEPTARFYTERQEDLCACLIDLVRVAYERAALLGRARRPAQSDYQLAASVTEVARADNLVLAQAAREIVAALAEMKAQGWIDDPTAVRLAFKFAGEAIDEDAVQRMLAEGEQRAK